LLTAIKNSIDIPPNALAQVAASIEHKHRNNISVDGSGSPYRYTAGQAFKAARRRSYIQLRKDTLGSQEMDEVTRMLESSPRKMTKRLVEGSLPKQTTLARRRKSTAVMGDAHRHHRVTSYQALVQRPSTSMDNNSRPNTRSERVSITGRSSYETIRPKKERRQSFARPRSSLQTRAVRGLRGSFDNGGPRLQKSTSGLGFDDSSVEIHHSSRG